jgi:hypothetical protein
VLAATPALSSAAALPNSYFLRRGETFESTELTRGPWEPHLQHGGPAAALLAGVIESHPEASGMTVARLTFELLRPLRVGGAFRVSVAEGRRGRRVRGLEAMLMEEDDSPAVRATALLVRHAEVPVGEVAPPPSIRRVADAEPWQFPFFTEPVSYHASMESRRAAGDFGSGAMTVWFRMTGTVVAGEEPTPLQRLAAAADSGNGVSVALDLRHYTFVNPDLTITLFRRPVGEWFALEARTLVANEGLGLADTRYWDERGVLGRGVQALLVEPRAGG